VVCQLFLARVICHLKQHTLFVWLINHQPPVLFSQNKPTTSNQSTVLFSQNNSASATRHQPNEHVDEKRKDMHGQ
jgi:hypothetical protein